MGQVPCARCRSECWEIGFRELVSHLSVLSFPWPQHIVTLTHHPSHPILPGPDKVGRAVVSAPGSWGAESPEGAMSAFGPCHLTPHSFQLGLDFLSLRQVPSDHQPAQGPVCTWLSCLGGFLA